MADESREDADPASIVVDAHPAFALCYGATPDEAARCEAALQRFIAPLRGAVRLVRVEVARAQTLWLACRADVSSEPTRALEQGDGERLFVIGTPFGDLRRQSIVCDLADPTRIALEGRWAAVQIRGDSWSITTDWARSVPVYHAALGKGGIISNVEPAVTSACAFGAAEVNRRGLVALLLFGHFIGNDSLFTPMQVLGADVRAVFERGRISRSTWRASVAGSDEHHGVSADAALEKMASLTREAVLSSLGGKTKVFLPLSAGMDARLAAAIIAEAGLRIDCASYGPANFAEVYFASEIAKALGHRWQRIDVVGHMERYKGAWLDQFGTALHFHGTHHYPLLDAIPPDAIVPSGWLGNSAAGGEHPAPCLFAEQSSLLDRFKGYGVMWSEADIARLLKGSVARELDELQDVFRSQLAQLRTWPHYQQMNALDLWNRQGRFVFFQTEMFGWKALERSPFMARRYATYMMSLPSHFLWRRNLQIKMLDRHWPAAAAVEASFRLRRSEAARQWHRLRYHATKHAPRPLRGLFGRTWYSDFWRDEAYVLEGSAAALPSHSLLDHSVAMDAVAAAARNATPHAYRKLLMILPVLHYFQADASGAARAATISSAAY